MTASVGDLVELVDRLAPPALASEWDNVGLLVGGPDRPLTRVLVALDLRQHVLDAAVAEGCQAILVHHPPIFPSLTSLTPSPGGEGVVLAAAEARVAIVAAHTNLDAVAGGLNDIMGELLGLTPTGPLDPSGADPAVGLGRLAETGGLSAAQLVAVAANAFDVTVRWTGDPEQPLSMVAWCTGSGGSLLPLARAAGAEAYVTGDLRYHDHDAAPDVTLLDLPHAAVEARCLTIWAERVLTPAAGSIGIQAVLHTTSTDPWSESRPGR